VDQHLATRRSAGLFDFSFMGLYEFTGAAALARVLRGCGEVHFATDIADYAAWTLERFARTRAFRWTAECAADWREPWPGYVPTRYEAKARREGRASSYLVFRREDRLAHTTTR